MLDLDASDSSVSVVRTGGWDRRFLLPLAGLLAVVAMTMVWGTGQGEPVEQAVDQESNAVPPTSTPTRPATTPSSESATADAEQPSPTEIQDIETNFDGPFGYDLLIATVGRPARLDLDTGMVSYVEGSRVFPRFVWGSWLIVESGSGVDVARLPLDDLGADPEPLLEVGGAVHGYMVSPISAVAKTGRLWIAVTAGFNTGEPTETLYEVDIETATVLQEREADAEGWRLASAQRDGLFTAPTGGVYQAAGDTYQRVTDGRVLTSDSQRALVQTCDDNLRCTLQWLDSQTWDSLDLFVPEDQDGLHVMIPGTDWIFTPRFERFEGPASGELLNIATGEVIDVDLPEAPLSGPSVSTPAVSPDGRWLATRGEDTKFLELRDLASGDTARIVLDERIAGPILFIDDSPQD